MFRNNNWFIWLVHNYGKNSSVIRGNDVHHAFNIRFIICTVLSNSSDLRFLCRTVLLGLPFFVFSATLRTRNDYGKIVFLAQLITQFPDVIIGLFAVVIFVVFNVVSRAKNDVIMDVPFVNMGGNNIRIFPL